MRVVALEFVLTGLPGAVLGYARTSLWVVEEQMWRSAEVLLPMSIVALAPVVNCGVAYWTEASFVAVEHELMICEHSF